MIITYHGLECFKIQFGNVVVATNPISKGSSAVAKVPRFGADIVLQSIQHPDFAGVENMAHGDKDPYVVRGPGEYEIQDVIIRGFPTVSHYGGTEHINTVYSMVLEGMHIVFLGPLDQKELPQEAIQGLDTIDILFTPVGGDGVLDTQTAYKLAVKYEPRMIIPMHYTSDTDTELKTFAEEGDADTVISVDKLTIKRRDVETKDGDIAILSIQ